MLPIAALIPGLFKLAEPVIDALFETDDEKASARIKIMQAQQQGELRKAEIALSAIISESQSQDKWTSRARPGFLYVIYTFILASIPMGILFAFSPTAAADVTSGVKLWLDAIPKEFITLFGVGYLGYTGARSWDKNKKHNSGDN